MTIETKYNIGDEVWFMFDEKPIRGTIKNIGSHISINVVINGNSYIFRREAKGFELFPTKEELLKSL